MSRRLVDGKRPTPRPGANKGGRPFGSKTLLEKDPSLIEKVAQVLSIGSHIEVAAAVNGIGYATLREWVLKGKEHPESLYGAFNQAVQKALSTAETRDLNTIDQHANGRDAVFEYEVAMQPVLDDKGKVILDAKGRAMSKPVLDENGKPLMVLARDAEGNPILKRSEIRPQWQAAAWKLERRNPHRWGRFDRVNADEVMQIDKQSKTKDVVSDEQYNRKRLELKQRLDNMEALDDDDYAKG